MKLLTADQMRQADAAAVARLGEVALMRTAGAHLAEAIAMRATAKRVIALAGPGNNGGDAFAAFADLDRSYERIVYAVPAGTPSAARRDAEQRASAAGVVVRSLLSGDIRSALSEAGAAVDALFGTGARVPADPRFVPAIAALNACRAPVIAVDIPTGVDATTGAAGEDAVRADLTLTLGALKVGLMLDPARAFVGELWLAPLGITEAEIDATLPSAATLDDGEFRALLPRRSAGAEKRSAGAPLIIAGSEQFPGAAVLCARGAARAGAGYVTVAAPRAAAGTLRHHLIEQVVVAWDDADVSASIQALFDLTNHASALAIGPGLPLADSVGEIVRGLIARVDLPLVIDASALFHLAKHLDVLHAKRCVLTPHRREFARLSGGGSVPETRRRERLREFVERSGCTTLLKGRATLVDDGNLLHVNATGSAALATAGTGDVLTGIIATLLSQGLAPVDAARAGAHWHGLAGQAAHRQRSVGVVAGDIAEHLADALRAAPDSGAALTRIF